MDTSDKIGDLQQQQQHQAAANGGGGSKQIVHVRGDSETELDLLFSVLNSRGDSKLPTRSFRDMNLPLSFFKPPDPKPPGCHSRDNSLDGSGAVVGHFAPGAGGLQPGQPASSGMNVFHSRSHSSPAQLPLSLSVAPSPGHLKQGSVDGGSASTEAIAGQQRQQQQQQQQQQQNAWSAANSQQAANKFFLSNANGMWPTDTALKAGALPAQGVTSLTCSSPNKPPSRVAKVVQNGHPVVAATQPLSGGLHNLGPLPHGWEQGVTPEGDIYYINHIEKTTSWFDPRIPKHMQKPVPVKASSAHSLQNRQQQQPQQQQQTPQQSHIAQQQQQPAQQSHQGTPASQLRPPAGSPAATRTGLTHNEQMIRHELMKLQKEKERLRREQEEAMRKEQMLLKELTKLKTTHTAAPPAEGNGLSGLMPAAAAVATGGGGGLLLQHQMVTSGVDPFLGQSVVAAAADSHGRQSSGDSGLGNMGAANYALLRSTEEFLGNIDSMDIHDSNILHKPQGVPQQQQQQQQSNDLSQLQQCMPSIDMPLLGDSADQLGMDSDDLVSSLTDDLAMNMDVQMMENIIQYI